MKGKIEKLEDIRNRSETLKPSEHQFPELLKDLAQETLGYLDAIDDEQEINWVKNALQIARANEAGKKPSTKEKERDLGLTYLKEALDSVLIREKNFLE